MLKYYFSRIFRSYVVSLDDQCFASRKWRSQIDHIVLPSYRFRVGKLADLVPKLVSYTAFSLLITTPQQDYMNLTAVVLGGVDQLFKLHIIIALRIAKSVDNIDFLAGSFGDNFQAKFEHYAPKCRSAEIENGLRTVDRHMVVKDLES